MKGGGARVRDIECDIGMMASLFVVPSTRPYRRYPINPVCPDPLQLTTLVFWGLWMVSMMVSVMGKTSGVNESGRKHDLKES